LLSVRSVCNWRAGGSCVFVALWVCYHDNSKLHLHQTWYVGEGSDHLQLIKFWPSRAPGKGLCSMAKIFGSALLQPARACSVCVPPSGFFHYSSLGSIEQKVIQVALGLTNIIIYDNNFNMHVTCKITT